MEFADDPRTAGEARLVLDWSATSAVRLSTGVHDEDWASQTKGD
jgi:hypothetical protein